MPKHERRTHEKPDTTQKNIYVGRRQLSLEERLSRQIRGQYRDIKTVEDWETSEEDQRETLDFEMPERKEFGEGYELVATNEKMKRLIEQSGINIGKDKEKMPASSPELPRGSGSEPKEKKPKKGTEITKEEGED